MIFRLDFEPNFSIIDSQGRILHILQKAGEGRHWPDLGITSDKHQVTGKKISREDGWLAAISVGPANISGHMESLEGIPLENIEDSLPVSRLFRIVNIIRKEFHVSNYKRTGVRFLLFEDDMESNSDGIKEAFLCLFDHNMVRDLSPTLGAFTDCGMAFDGSNEDGINFHLKWGPYREGELKRHLQEFDHFYRNCISSPYKTDSDIALTIDIDFYETDHQLHESVGFGKWCRPLIDRALRMKKDIEETIIRQQGEREC